MDVQIFSVIDMFVKNEEALSLEKTKDFIFKDHKFQSIITRTKYIKQQ